MGYSYVREKITIEVWDKKSEKEHFDCKVKLFYVIHGSMDLTVEGRTSRLKKEDICVVNPNRKFSYNTEDDILFCEMSIPYAIIEEAYGESGVYFFCDSTLVSEHEFSNLRMIMNKLLVFVLQRKEDQIRMGEIGLYFYVLEVLTANFSYKSSEKNISGKSEKYEDRILYINNYLRSNYARAVSLNELSEELFLSNAYLSRFFKKNYGMNFMEYLTNIRLYHAVEDLEDTKDSITKIALDNGFSSVAVFNRSFKCAYGITPSTYRKKKKVTEQNRDLLSNEIKLKLEQYLKNKEENTLDREAESKIQVSCHATTFEQFDKYWNRLINIGSAEDIIKSDIQEHIIFLQKELQFQYVRFWNVFSETMMIYSEDCPNQYNFNKIDVCLDFLVEKKIRPFIELGLKPRRVQKNTYSTLLFEEEKTSFRSIVQWRQLMSAFVRHILLRYGGEEVSGWKFELWNDQANSCGYEMEDKSDYFTLFHEAYKIIKSMIPEAEVGGGGFTAKYSESKSKYILNDWAKKWEAPDFISVFNYAYVMNEDDFCVNAKRTTDLDVLLNDVLFLKNLLREIHFQVPYIYVTEWNQTISDRNYLNDSCYKGAYTMRTLISGIGNLSVLGHFTGSDRVSDYFDSGELLYGGTGLISRDGIIKPSGYAFKFMNNLYPYLLKRDENYVITTNKHGSYAIACHNLKPLNYYYYLSDEDKLDKEKLWEYFDDLKSLEIDFTLDDIEPGEYVIKIHQVNEKNGSILDCWGELDYYDFLTREDIRYLKKKSEPKLTIQRRTVSVKTFHFSHKMSVNEIALIEILHSS